MEGFSVAARFCGPPGCANGGYLAGRFARCDGTAVSIRLERPVPLETPLTVRAGAGAERLLGYADVICVRMQPALLSLELPPAPTYGEALAASRQYAGFARHGFPYCFVCGTQRAAGDGLRVFAGPLARPARVAAAWIADASLADAGGDVRPEFISAALDCPGYFAARDDGVPMLLGQYTVQIDRSVRVDEPCVIVGWRIGGEGRKREVGTVLFDASGRPCARARGLWIEPRGSAAPR